MSTSIQADYTLVSWLEEAENALTNDLYLVSQYDTDTDEWISKKLSYDKLCALVLNGIDNRVSATCSAYLEDLSVKIDTLSISLSSTSCLLDDTVSAVIKMANCIQTNKSNINSISGFMLNNIAGENGISVIRPVNLSSNSKLKIGHQKSITAAKTGLYKLGYDKYGHISSKADVLISDILDLGSIISGAGEGLVANGSKHLLSLSAATTTTLGGIKVGDNLSITDGKLSARDTTYGPATSSDIGLIKPGVNLAVAADGTLSVRDTAYSAGEGLIRSGTTFQLSSAGPGSIGGIKVGAKRDSQTRVYPVTLSTDGCAYVSVDWVSVDAEEFVPKSTLNDNILSSPNNTYMLTALRQQAGNVIAVSSSNFVWTKVLELSNQLSSTALSNAFSIGNGLFIKDDQNTVSVYAVSNAVYADSQNFIDSFQLNPYVIGGEYTNTKYIERGDGTIVPETGDFLKFIYNYVDNPNPTTSAFYVDLEPVLSHDQFVQSAWYVSSEHTIIIQFKDDSKDELSIDIGDMINIYGQEGDVAYLTPNDGIKNQTILRSDVYVCENDNDLTASLANKLSFKEVFDSWHVGDMYSNKNYGYSSDYPRNYRTLNECLTFQQDPASYHYPDHTFSLTSYNQLTSQVPENNWLVHTYKYYDPTDSSLTSLEYGGQYTSCAIDSQAFGYNFWVYNSAISSIIQPMNTNGWSFYYSPLKYTNYDIEVELASTNSDNDYIGLVAAVNEDVQGKQHVLSFVRVGGTNDKFGDTPEEERTPDNALCSWLAIVDEYDWPTPITPSSSGHTQNVIAAARPSDESSTFNHHWSTGGKTKIKISRRGNSLTAWTTPFYTSGSPAYEAPLIVNLANVKGLTCFSEAAGGGSVGFTTNSQPMSYYKILSLNLPKTIAKTYTNELCTFYGDGSSTCIQGNIAKEVGIGRFTKNLATGKTFYINNSSFTKIAEI